jgi:predicted metal-dependent hydrolase
MEVTTTRYQIQFGSSQIDFQLSYAQRKSLNIQVHPDRSVHVIAPMESDLEKVITKVKGKAPWIIQQQDFFLSFYPLTPVRKYVSGETHLYLGRQYRLNIIENATKSVKLQHGYIQLSTPDKKDKVVIRQQLNNWYSEKANLHFPILMKKVFPKFKKYNFESPNLVIRFMEKRWGSCTANHKIILNTELIKAPKSDIEYVIAHELCHIIYPNHSRAFFQLLTNILPNWKKYKQHLERLIS